MRCQQTQPAATQAGPKQADIAVRVIGNSGGDERI
jgi:hypothetical protein